MFEYICWFIKAYDDSYLYKSIFHSFLAKIISVLFYLNRPKHTTLLSCELFIAGNELPAEGPVSFLSAIKTVVLHFCGKHFFLFWIQLIGEGYNTSRATLGLYVLQSQPPVGIISSSDVIGDLLTRLLFSPTFLYMDSKHYERQYYVHISTTGAKEI